MALVSRIPQIIRRVESQVSSVNKQSAERIAQDARRRVPVKTGRTRDSIRAQRAKGDDWEAVVGFPGQFIERGTARVAARPFMVPAAEAERAAHRKAIRELYK
jgi:HK97 gp10 family phage protein